MPLSLAVIPWGVLTGALAIEAGFSAFQAQLMSLIVFAGAAQLSAITLIAAGSSFASIFASTVVISSRHLLYSITFRQHVEALPLRLRLLIGFLLTDEMFAVSQAHSNRSGTFSALFAIVSGATFYLFWNISTLLG
ncbi:MAG: putative branched-subunit amino acid permease, partial [Paracoccaceae bacterium]